MCLLTSLMLSDPQQNKPLINFFKSPIFHQRFQLKVLSIINYAITFTTLQISKFLSWYLSPVYFLFFLFPRNFGYLDCSKIFAHPSAGEVRLMRGWTGPVSPLSPVSRPQAPIISPPRQSARGGRPELPFSKKHPDIKNTLHCLQHQPSHYCQERRGRVGISYRIQDTKERHKGISSSCI